LNKSLDGAVKQSQQYTKNFYSVCFTISDRKAKAIILSHLVSIQQMRIYIILIKPCIIIFMSVTLLS